MGKKNKKEAAEEVEPVNEEVLETEEVSTEDEQITISVDEYEQLKNAQTEAREQMMRQQAEFENTRRRLRKTADEAGTRSLASFIRPILNEMDNFEMAIKAANPEKFNDFAMGITMIHENLKGIFSGSGVEIIPAEGVFDPALHEVVAEIEQEGAQRGEIIGVQRTGYKMNDQVVRAAQVIVGKPPAAAEETEPEESSDEEETEEQSAEA